jgi:hypothetical protein
MGLIRRRSSTVTRRAIPWLLVLQLLREGQAHVKENLTARERSRGIELLKASKGRPGSLSPREQEELKALAAKLDLKGFGTRAALSTAGHRVGRRH